MTPIFFTAIIVEGNATKSWILLAIKRVNKNQVSLKIKFSIQRRKICMPRLNNYNFCSSWFMSSKIIRDVKLCIKDFQASFKVYFISNFTKFVEWCSIVITLSRLSQHLIPYLTDLFHVVWIEISANTFVMSAKSNLLRLDSEGCDHKKFCQTGLYHNMQLSP